MKIVSFFNSVLTKTSSTFRFVSTPILYHGKQTNQEGTADLEMQMQKEGSGIGRGWGAFIIRVLVAK